MDKAVTALLGLDLVLASISHLQEAEWYPIFAVVGVLCIIGALILLLLTTSNLQLGSPKLYIPLSLLVIIMLLSSSNLSSDLFALSIPAIYLVAVNLRKSLNWLWFPLVTITTLSLILLPHLSGGITGNRNIAACTLIVGTLMTKSKYSWLLSIIAIVGLLFTGAEEALVGLVILGVAVLVRHDWSKKLGIVGGVGVLVIVVTITMGLWAAEPIRLQAVKENAPDITWSYRIEAWKMSITDIKLLGHGYSPLNVSPTTIHDVPLNALYSVGPLGMLLWLYITFYTLFKTKSKYLILALIALSLFDHFLWTSQTPMYWAAIGLASTNRGTTYLYRKE